MRASLVALALFATLALFPTLALAQGPLAVEAEDAADHHVSAQGRYPGGIAHSWEWSLGSKKSARNITGITAHGLLAIHRITGLDEHQKSAVRAARSLLSAYDRGWKNERPHTQDIEFLAAAGFIIDAARWFKVTTSRFSPQALMDLVLERRRAAHVTVAGWDAASAIRAALAVGQVAYARGLLTEALRRQGEWDRPALGQSLARGSLLWAMAELRDRGGLDADEQRVAQGLVRELTAVQERSGAWREAPRSDVICTQTTAYAILGLSRFTDGQTSAERGRAWLLRSALVDQRFFVGGKIWATTYTRQGQPENDFNAEIQSEALLALATKKGR